MIPDLNLLTFDISAAKYCILRKIKLINTSRMKFLRTTKIFLFRISHRISHFFKAKNAHGIHSPFLFLLYNQVIKNASKQKGILEIEKLRKDFTHSLAIITTYDYGTGGIGNKILQKPLIRQTPIAHIAKNALKPTKEAVFLYNLANYLNAGLIWEFGTSLGITTLYLANAKELKELHTIEACPNTQAMAINNFHAICPGNQKVRFHTGEIEKILPDLQQNSPPPDMICFDANHDGKATLEYFYQCVKHKHSQSVFIFDDIYWSPSMHQAWITIKNHPEVRMSLDLFSFGIIFFNPGFSKEDFRIRF